jgi:hypothetical protein
MTLPRTFESERSRPGRTPTHWRASSVPRSVGTPGHRRRSSCRHHRRSSCFQRVPSHGRAQRQRDGNGSNVGFPADGVRAIRQGQARCARAFGTLDGRVDLRRRGLETNLEQHGLVKPGPPADCLALPPLISPDPEVQIDAVALPLDLVDLALAVVLTVMLLMVPGLGAGRLAPAGRVTPVLAGRLVACLAADLSSSCRHRPGPPSSLA